MSLRRSSHLRTAINEWTQEGLLSSDSAKILTDRYELDSEAPWYQNVSFLVSIVAVVLVSMGFVLGISQNWDQLSIPVRVMSGAIPWLLSAGFTVWALFTGRTRLAEAWGLLMCLLYGTNIFLQAQIFHISGYSPTAMMWWVIGCLPVAFVLRSHAITFLTQALTVVWIGMESQFDHFTPLVLPIGALVLLVTQPTLGRTTMLGAIAVVIWMLHHVRGPIYGMDAPTDPFTAMVAGGVFAMALLSVAQQVQKSFRIKASWVVLGFILIQAFVASSVDGMETVSSGPVDWYAALIAGIGSAILLWADRSPLSILASIIAVWFGAESLVPASNFVFTIFTVGLNVIVFGGAVLMIYLGVQQQNKTWFMGGLSLIVIHAIVRYFDLFDSYLVSSVIFILAGIGLVAANRFWKGRFDA